MNENKANLRILLVIAAAAIGAIYFIATYVVPRVLVTMTKAAPATVISLPDSRLLGERILARADGKDQASINVFVMDKSGKGVSGKSVALTGMEGITPTETATDANGRANFKVTSAVEGQYTLEASVEGSILPGKIVVTFRN